MDPGSHRYAALIRGLNNIGTRRVAMADLRALFQRLGFRDVRTLLHSGNVVFSAGAVRRRTVLARIEKALSSGLGVTSPVVLLTQKEVVAAVRGNPFSRIAIDPSHFLVVALRRPSNLRELRPLLNERWTPEAFALGRRVAYLWCAKGVARSPLWAAVDRALERTGTARNITTMTKLMGLVKGPRGDGRGRHGALMKPVWKAGKDIDEYISAFPPAVRVILRNIRLTILRNAPGAQEMMSYRMPAFRMNGILLYFAAFRNHICLYPPVSGDRDLNKVLAHYAGPKGNLRFPLDQPIPYSLIRRIVKLRVMQDREKASAKKRNNR